MPKQSQEQLEYPDSGRIEDSIENLSPLSEKVQEVRQERIQDIQHSSDTVTKDMPNRTGVIVPRPSEKETDTGEINNGRLVIWVKDETTGDVEKKKVSFPNVSGQYNRENAYIRLCSLTDVNYTEPEGLLYEEIPICDKDRRGVSFKIDLPEDATPVERFKSKSRRTIENWKVKTPVRVENGIKSVLGIASVVFSLFATFTDWPVRVPQNSDMAAQMGYSPSIGALMFFGMSFLILGGLGTGSYLTLNYTLPCVSDVVKSSWKATKDGLNTLIDGEQDILKRK